MYQNYPLALRYIISIMWKLMIQLSFDISPACGPISVIQYVIKVMKVQWYHKEVNPQVPGNTYWL